MRELEEDFDVLDAMSSVHEIVHSSEHKCDEFKEHFVKYSYLWTRHLPEALQVYLRFPARCQVDSQRMGLKLLLVLTSGVS